MTQIGSDCIVYLANRLVFVLMLEQRAIRRGLTAAASAHRQNAERLTAAAWSFA